MQVFQNLNAMKEICWRSMLVVMVVITVSSLCAAQETIGPTDSDAERFALEIASSPSAKRTELVAAHPERITVALRRQLIQHGNMRFASIEYAQALEIYQLVEKISDQIGDKEGVATSWLNMGSVYYFQGDYARAIDHYRKAEAAFAALNNHSEAGRCRFGIALTYQSQRNFTEALKAFGEALKEFETAKNTTEIANTLASIGGLQYEMGNYEAAQKSFLRIVE